MIFFVCVCVLERLFLSLCKCFSFSVLFLRSAQILHLFTCKNYICGCCRAIFRAKVFAYVLMVRTNFINFHFENNDILLCSWTINGIGRLTFVIIKIGGPLVLDIVCDDKPFTLYGIISFHCGALSVCVCCVCCEMHRCKHRKALVFINHVHSIRSQKWGAYLSPTLFISLTHAYEVLEMKFR